MKTNLFRTPLLIGHANLLMEGLILLVYYPVLPSIVCVYVLYNLLYNSCLSRFGPSNESEFKVRLVYLGGVEGLAERSRAGRFLISPGYIWFPPRILPAGGRSHFFFPWVGELFCSFSGSRVSRTAGARTFSGAPDRPN